MAFWFLVNRLFSKKIRQYSKFVKYQSPSLILFSAPLTCGDFRERLKTVKECLSVRLEGTFFCRNGAWDTKWEKTMTSIASEETLLRNHYTSDFKDHVTSSCWRKTCFSNVYCTLSDDWNIAIDFMLLRPPRLYYAMFPSVHSSN